MNGNAALIEQAQAILRGTSPIGRPSPLTEIGPPIAMGARVRVLSSIQELDINWIWRSYIPRGMLTLLGALPGVGKSTLTAWLAATLSRGGVLPDGVRAPVANTLMLLAEDSFEYTTKARLRLHDADESRIFEFSVVVDGEGNERFFNLRDHIEELRQVIDEYRIGLIVLDPISSFMPRTDRNSEGDVRDALSPLLKLIDETNVALVAVVHVGKATDKRVAQQMIMGSTAFTAVARVVIMTADIPNQTPGNSEKKVLQVVKSNIDAKPPAIAWSRKLDEPIEWHGPSSISFEEATLSASRDTSKAIDQAQALILDETKGGSRLVAELEALALDDGISGRTFRRAKETLQEEGRIELFKEREAQGKGRWFLRWPRQTSPAPTKVTTEGDTENVAALAALDPLVSYSGHITHQDDQDDQDGQEIPLGQLATLPSAHPERMKGLFPEDEEYL